MVGRDRGDRRVHDLPLVTAVVGGRGGGGGGGGGASESSSSLSKDAVRGAMLEGTELVPILVTFDEYCLTPRDQCINTEM